MTLEDFWQGLADSAPAQYIAGSTWAFPTIETLHVISIVTVLGSLLAMDLRMLGLTSKDYAFTRISRDTLTITWMAFVCAVITGSLLFISKAVDYTNNPWFIRKMVVMALAGANMLFFHFVTWKNVKQWDTGSVIPTGAKVAAVLSLCLWVMIVFFGRMVGFTLGMFGT